MLEGVGGRVNGHVVGEPVGDVEGDAGVTFGRQDVGDVVPEQPLDVRLRPVLVDGLLAHAAVVADDSSDVDLAEVGREQLQPRSGARHPVLAPLEEGPFVRVA